MWAVNHKYCLTLCFQIFLISNCVVSSNTKLLHFFYFLLLHLLLSFLSPRHCSFSASFFFFFFFPSFLHIYCFCFLSLFLFHLFTLMLLWVLLYFFMGLFVFELVGFVWAYAEEGETAAGFLFMGCVFVRWLGCVSWVFKGWDQWVWVVGSGRRWSGASFGSGSNQVQQLWVSSENSWEFSLGFLYLYSVSIYRPKQPNFAGMASMRPVQLVFFSVRNKRGICTGALAGTVYTGRTGRYSTELTSLA